MLGDKIKKWISQTNEARINYIDVNHVDEVYSEQRSLFEELRQLQESHKRCEELEKENALCINRCGGLIAENEQLKADAELGNQIREYATEGWWCPNCKEMLDGSRVTHQERCDTCGTGVSWIEQLEKEGNNE